jgi:L-ascorbate metabolism protein UlaG (beta-lactamase superfamily)
MQISLIGHSTVLIEAGGQTILTDPYFGAWGNIAFARLAPPAKKSAELCGVDFVLISHNHWDHTDRRFLRALGEDTPVLVPRWAAWETKLLGAKKPLGMRVWEAKQLGSFKVTAVPALHVAITHGYVIECEGTSIYFAGDTYYSPPIVQEIARRFPLDVAMIPVTTFRIPMTMSESSAVQAVRDLEPTVVIPIHLGIQPRSPFNRTGQTAQGFARRVREAGLKTDVVILKEGESWLSPEKPAS